MPVNVADVIDGICVLSACGVALNIPEQNSPQKPWLSQSVYFYHCLTLMHKNQNYFKQFFKTQGGKMVALPLLLFISSVKDVEWM